MGLYLHVCRYMYSEKIGRESCIYTHVYQEEVGFFIQVSVKAREETSTEFTSILLQEILTIDSDHVTQCSTFSRNLGFL